MATERTDGAPATAPPGDRETRRRPARRGGGAALREEIIEAATRELASTGDAGTITLRGIARAVGVAATSIYLHFDSVEDLVDAVKLTQFARLDALLRQAADDAGSEPTVRVRARARAYVRFWQERPGEYAAMFAARLFPRASTAPRQPQVTAALDDLGADIAAAWRRPADLDRPPSTEAALCAVHLWTGLHGMLSLRMVRPHLPWPDLGHEVDDLVDRLLRSGPSSP